MQSQRRQILAALAAGAATLSGAVQAQSLSGRPIKLIVPFAAGGANDLIARAIQRPLGEALKTNVIVQNIPGGSTKIATAEVLRAEHLFRARQMAEAWDEGASVCRAQAAA